MRHHQHLSGSREAAEPRRVQILLVDDNDADVWLFREALDSLRIRHDLRVARDGEEALALLKQPAAALPEIILLDISMPKVDGFAVLTSVRADPRLRAIPVIMLSSSRDQRDVLRAHELGANSYLCKATNDFADLVGDFDRYWLRRAELPRIS